MCKTTLDVSCGSRMFWFERDNPMAVYMDKRRERHILKDKSSKGGSRSLIIDPDLQASYANLPFADNAFRMVVFDPPHLTKAGENGWMAKKYGKLEGDWRAEMRDGFSECFRVLQPGGTLIFKWSEWDIPVSEILALTEYRPLVGHRSGKASKTHWLIFMKELTHHP